MKALRAKRTGRGMISAALVWGSILAAQPALAKTTLKANSQWPEAHSGSQVDKWWAEEIEKRTDGEVQVRLFFSGALGKAGENLELMRSGALEIAMMSPGYFPAQLPM